ncbi:hypothetical protein PS1_038625 [Malus domestica]
MRWRNYQAYSSKEKLIKDPNPFHQEWLHHRGGLCSWCIFVRTSSALEKVSPVVVFAHGAGAPSSSDWMIRWKKMLEKALNALEVVIFDYPYISGGKKRAPSKAEKLVDFRGDVAKKAVAKYPGHPLILAGKPMGSRLYFFLC